MAQEDEQDDAARAFEDLTAEVRVMRRAVEALEAKKATDYAPTLAAVTQELENLRGAMAVMARRPAVALTPEAYAAQIDRAANDAARPAVAELQRVQTLTGTLERAVGRVKTGEDQRRELLRTGGGALRSARCYARCCCRRSRARCRRAGMFPRSSRRASSAPIAGRRGSA